MPSTTNETLPYISSPLPGVKGRLRDKLEHFVVKEIPAYEPSGEGEHTILWITKRGLTSKHVQEDLAHLFGLRPQDVGLAGMKDRYAIATQAFSVPHISPEEAVERIQEALPYLKVHWARRHSNKLKPGHLRGNYFRITVVDVAPNALDRARAIADIIRQVGVPNYYGEQRFGRRGDNAMRGREILQGRRVRDKWLRRFLLSAYQANLFNRYLARRIRMGAFTHLLLGDIAKKADTGGLFVVEDVEQEQPRYRRGEIHFTGPMYGYKLWMAEKEAGLLEQTLLDEEGITLKDFRHARVKGTRRLGRLWLPDLKIEQPEAGVLTFAFSLPKGAFATTVLREFMKAQEPDNESSG